MLRSSSESHFKVFVSSRSFSIPLDFNQTRGNNERIWKYVKDFFHELVFRRVHKPELIVHPRLFIFLAYFIFLGQYKFASKIKTLGKVLLGEHMEERWGDLTVIIVATVFGDTYCTPPLGPIILFIYGNGFMTLLEQKIYTI